MVTPNIFAVRVGYATNSSSMHSLIFDPSLSGDWNGDHYGSGGIVTSARDKARYFRAQFGRGPEADDYPIDHQSVWGTESFRDQFMREVVAWAMQPGVALLLDSDGGDMPEGAFEPESLQRVKKRRDPLGYWTLWTETYRHAGGMRVRFNFGKKGDCNVKPVRSSWPELVDFKITERCTNKCEFCYQDSSFTGRNASREQLSRAVDQLRAMHVFEAAIGGGEPTLHPDFAWLLQTMREGEWSVVPNFTTRSLEWLKSRKIVHAVESYCGGWAYSAHSLGEIVTLGRELDRHFCNDNGYHLRPVNVHVVIGGPLTDKLPEVVTACADARVGLTLLGFKSVGRAERFAPKRLRSGWLKKLGAAVTKEVTRSSKAWREKYDAGNYNRVDPRKIPSAPPVSIDTILAQQEKDELDACKVPEETYDLMDGTFSMYIDAVDGKCGPSSYEPERMRPLPSSPEKTSALFQTFYYDQQMAALMEQMAAATLAMDMAERERIEAAMVELDAQMEKEA